jgi:plasmid stabilization system protein ParE
MRIEVLDDAKDDLVDGFDFYEQQSPGLGSYFLDSLFSDIDSLLLYAGIHRIVYSSHRCIASRFPYAIYYRVEGEVIRVRAVVDCRRDPAWIRRRLRRGGS